MKKKINKYINDLIQKNIINICKMAIKQNCSFNYVKNNTNFTLTVEIEEETFAILYYYDKVFDVDVFNAIDYLYKKLSTKI